MEQDVFSRMGRRAFLLGAASCGIVGCRASRWFGNRPNLSFGVVSDIHVTTPESAAKFRRALAYFRDRGADAVLVAGDLTDWGLGSGLKAVADAWYDVFPDDRAPDGRKVEKLFVTGNHDFEGWWYGDMTLDMHVQGYSEDDALVRAGMRECWERTFHEPYADIRRRTVRGYDFISSEFMVDGKRNGDAAMARWLNEHAAELRGNRPFFFFRHSPIPGTVVRSRGKKGADTSLTEALGALPNAVAFNGHTHWTLHDERSIWQGGFTAVSIPSMAYASVPGDCENGNGPRDGTSVQAHARLPSRVDSAEAQGFFVTVWPDSLEIERRDFDRMAEASAPWVVPLGPGAAKPFDWDVRKTALPVPQFAANTVVRTRTVNCDTRGGHWRIFMELGFGPATCGDGGRVFDYEVRAEAETDGRALAVKRFLAPDFYKSRTDGADLAFLFDAMDLPETGRYRFAVYPRNCFGVAGRPAYSRVYESAPGKDGTKYHKRSK